MARRDPSDSFRRYVEWESAAKLLPAISPRATDPASRCYAAALAIALDKALGDEMVFLHMRSKDCESPIEELMLYGLFAAGHAHFDEVIVTSKVPPLAGGWVLAIGQQVQVGDFRVDFLLRAYRSESDADNRPRWREEEMIVECDGHDFHEKTRAQARRDKSRDRALQSLGMPVYRYTGSEIWADPFGCAEQAVRDLFERGA